MNPRALRFLLLLFLFAAVCAVAGWPGRGFAQAARSSGTSSAAAERAAVELRQGMTTDEVRELLGKPWRTALSGNGNAGDGAPARTLRWTYTWTGSRSSASSERILNVDFNAKTAEQWNVSGWNWSAY